MNQTLAAPKKFNITDILFDPERGKAVMVFCAKLAESDMIPKHFQGKPSNVFVALNMSARMDVDIFGIMQSMYVVHGSPGFSTSFMIARAKATGAFTGPIEYDVTGGDELAEGCPKNQKLMNYTVVARATLSASGNEVVSPPVSMEMVISEGWSKRSSKSPGQASKYETMPTNMMQKRAAAMLIRTYCPDAILGMSTTDELEEDSLREVRADVVDDNAKPNGIAGQLAASVKREDPAETEKAEDPEQAEQSGQAEPDESKVDEAAEAETAKIERRRLMIEKFGEFDVSPEDIERRCGCKIDDITQAMIVGLIAVFRKIEADNSLVSKYFPEPDPIDDSDDAELEGVAG